MAFLLVIFDFTAGDPDAPVEDLRCLFCCVASALGVLGVLAALALTSFLDVSGDATSFLSGAAITSFSTFSKSSELAGFSSDFFLF